MPGFEIFDDAERRSVQDVLDTGVLFRYGFDQARKGHWKAKAFESELARRLNAGHCHLCSSGTAALWTAIASCGIGVGDEVIVPPFTFIATIEAVLCAGAVPVFSEIDDTLCLDPGMLEDAISPRTKAVIPVHMCGATARIQEIKEVCDKNNLIMIEDACQAFGASYRGQALGTFGKMGCFSFDSVKTITCGEGGAVVTNQKDLYAIADGYADHGHDHVGNDRGLEGHPILGTNFRISELNAAVGLAQLKKIDVILEKQRANKNAIMKVLESCPDVSFQHLPDPEGDSATFLSFFLPSEDHARGAAKRLAEGGIDGCFYWYDNNWHYLRNWEHLKQLKTAARLPIRLMDHCPDYENLVLPQSDRIMGRTISLQIKLSWSETELSERALKMADILNG